MSKKIKILQVLRRLDASEVAHSTIELAKFLIHSGYNSTFNSIIQCLENLPSTRKKKLYYPMVVLCRKLWRRKGQSTLL